MGLGGVGGGRLSRACRAGTVRVTLVRRSPASLGRGRTGPPPSAYIYELLIGGERERSNSNGVSRNKEPPRILSSPPGSLLRCQR